MPETRNIADKTETEVTPKQELKERAAEKELELLNRFRERSLEKTGCVDVADMVFEINLYTMKSTFYEAGVVGSEYSERLFDEIDETAEALVDPAGFSREQAECMALKDIGLTSGSVAAVMDMKKSTVETHLKKSREKATDACRTADTLEELNVTF